MNRDTIHPSCMDVKNITQIFRPMAEHSMPSGIPHSPWAFHHDVLGPEGKICRMSFLFVNLTQRLPSVPQVYSRQLAIIGTGDVKIYTVAGLVRISLLNGLPQGNHLRDMICGLTDDLRFSIFSEAMSSMKTGIVIGYQGFYCSLAPMIILSSPSSSSETR